MGTKSFLIFLAVVALTPLHAPSAQVVRGEATVSAMTRGFAPGYTARTTTVSKRRSCSKSSARAA